MENGHDEFEAIEPGVVGTCVIGVGKGARTVHVRPLSFEKIPIVGRAVKPILADIQMILNGGRIDGSIMDMVIEYFDPVCQIMAAASDVPEDEIRKAEIEQVLELFSLVMQANKGFFSGRLAKALRVAAQLSDQAGATPSSH